MERHPRAAKYLSREECGAQCCRTQRRRSNQTQKPRFGGGAVAVAVTVALAQCMASRRSTAPFLPHHPLQPQILFALGGAVTIACGKPSGKKLLNTVCYDGGPKGTTALRWHMHCNAKLWPNSRAGVVGRVVAGCLASAGHLYQLLTVHLPP